MKREVEIHSEPLNAAVALKNVLEEMEKVELDRPLHDISLVLGEMDEHGNYVESSVPWGAWGVKHEDYEVTVQTQLVKSRKDGQPVMMLVGSFNPEHQSVFLDIAKSVRERCNSDSIYRNENP
jgi:hypothetical protein